MNKESKSLHGYLRGTTEWMLQAALKEKVLEEEENLQDYQKRRTEEKIRNWKEEALHGEFMRQTEFKRGKLATTTSIRLDEETTIKELQQEDSYKYLGINVAEGIQHAKMKYKKGVL